MNCKQMEQKRYAGIQSHCVAFNSNGNETENQQRSAADDSASHGYR